VFIRQVSHTLQLLNKLTMPADEIDLALTTGGSSRTPAFRRVLGETLPRARLQESDLFTSVASGLAVSGALHPGRELN
jgi:molecular chaperone DnaK (HSP70)